MHLLPRYRRRLIFAPFNLAYPTLQDNPDFDLRNHLFCHEMRRDTTEATLMKTVMSIYEEPLDRGKPLWEVHLFNGLGRPQRNSYQGPSLPRGRDFRDGTARGDDQHRAGRPCANTSQ